MDVDRTAFEVSAHLQTQHGIHDLVLVAHEVANLPKHQCGKEPSLQLKKASKISLTGIQSTISQNLKPPPLPKTRNGMTLA